MTGQPKKIGALVFPGFELLDLFGPLQMFGMLTDRFDIEIVAQTEGPVVSGQGPRIVPDRSFGETPEYDLVLVPGGQGTRREIENPELLDWIRRASDKAEITMSVCTGSALLAIAGLLDGRRATTNKYAFGWVASLARDVDWVPEARWVEDRNIFTSSGVSAGIDMSLAVIANVFDQETAEKIAAYAEYEWHQDKAWDPFAKMRGLV